MSSTIAQRFILPKHGRDFLIARISKFLQEAMPDKQIIVTVEQYKKERTIKQNNSLFGVAYPAMMAHIGLQGDEEKKALHKQMCGMFFGWSVSEVYGVKRRVPKRTTTRNEEGKPDVIKRDQMSEFYAFVQRVGSENGCYVPDPDPLWLDSLV